MSDEYGGWRSNQRDVCAALSWLLAGEWGRGVILCSVLRTPTCPGDNVVTVPGNAAKSSSGDTDGNETFPPLWSKVLSLEQEVRGNLQQGTQAAIKI